jgi:electron transport complex protein RnfD
MWFVVIALLPALISAVVFFGPYQLVIVLTSILFCLGTEVAIKKIRKRNLSYEDGSAVITGILLALVLPPNFSLSGTAIGAVFSIAIGKEIFGDSAIIFSIPRLQAAHFYRRHFLLQ